MLNRTLNTMWPPLQSEFSTYFSECLCSENGIMKLQFASKWDLVSRLIWISTDWHEWTCFLISVRHSFRYLFFFVAAGRLNNNIFPVLFICRTSRREQSRISYFRDFWEMDDQEKPAGEPQCVKPAKKEESSWPRPILALLTVTHLQQFIFSELMASVQSLV